MHGYREKKATGRYPDPEELSRRIKPRWIHDVDKIEELVERTRPKDKNPAVNGA